MSIMAVSISPRTSNFTKEAAGSQRNGVVQRCLYRLWDKVSDHTEIPQQKHIGSIRSPSCPKGAPRCSALYQDALEATPSTVMTLMVMALDIYSFYFTAKSFRFTIEHSVVRNLEGVSLWLNKSVATILVNVRGSCSFTVFPSLETVSR